MKHKPLLLSLLALFAVSSCTPKEEEQEPDYDNMVMADEEEEWTSVEEDKKIIAGDLPDPQELIPLDIPGQEKEGSFEELR